MMNAPGPEGVVEPGKQAKPALHGPLGLDNPVESQNDPAGHEVGRDDPTGHIEPTGHGDVKVAMRTKRFNPSVIKNVEPVASKAIEGFPTPAFEPKPSTNPLERPEPANVVTL
jgi:hypothetical protein